MTFVMPVIGAAILLLKITASTIQISRQMIILLLKAVPIND